MNHNLKRGLALVAITAGFTFLGATAANAAALDDNPGLLGNGGPLGTGLLLGSGAAAGDGMLSAVHASAPVAANGARVSVLDSSALGTGRLLRNGSAGGSDLFGDGVLVTSGHTAAELFANPAVAGLSGRYLGSTLSTALDVPANVSNSWVSILGNPANGPTGVVVVPNASANSLAVASDGHNGVLDAFAGVAADVSCSSITVLSNYDGASCGQATALGEPTASTEPTEAQSPSIPGLPTVGLGNEKASGVPTLPYGDDTSCPTSNLNAGLTSADTPSSAAENFALIGIAGIAGGLIAAATLLIGRKFSKLN